MTEFQFAICGCYFSRNIFVKSLKLHTNYESVDQFLSDYGNLIKQKRLQTNSILQEVRAEIERRKSFVEGTEKRRQLIKSVYKPKSPNLFDFQENFLDPEFIKFAQICNSNDTNAAKKYAFQYQIKDQYFELYHFPVLTKEFCKNFIDEIQNFLSSDAPKVQPNTMNKYGVLLDDIGFTPFMEKLRNFYLNSISKILFPQWVGEKLDSHRAFTVKYSVDSDRQLDLHFDNAEVTLNVSLDENYLGGNIYFQGLKYDPEPTKRGADVKHRMGWAILHRGRQLHSALPLTQGERHNLIFWMRSSSIRNEICPMCENPPQFLPVQGHYGDGFRVVKKV